MTRKSLFRIAALFAGAAALLAEDGAPGFYRAIRNNDLAALEVLARRENVNQKDARGTTPLHHAAAYGSSEAVGMLLAAGADANARNAFDATPLMWAATDFDKVRRLVAGGADVNARSKMGRTAVWLAAANDGSSAIVRFLLDHGARLDGSEILAATAADDSATIRLLLERGADVNAKDPVGMTPLMNAAANGNTKIAELLIARGAKVNAVSAAEINGSVKAGKIALGSFTPLLLASVYGPADLVRVLLDAGAGIDARDVRGMTPLMNAVATDHADARIARLLLDRGADVKARDSRGLSAADWAAMQNNPAILRELGLNRRPAYTSRAVIPAAQAATGTARSAAARSIDLLQRASGSFFEGGGCGSCHSANLLSIAVNAAAANGIAVNEAAKQAEIKGAMLALGGFEQPLLQRGDPPAVEILTYAMLQVASEHTPAGPATDAIVHNLMAQQRQAGNWHVGGIARPPMMDGDISRTATAIRALALYAPAGRKAEAGRRIERAAGWLAAAPVRTTEDLCMQLLGLAWSGSPRHSRVDGLRKLVSLQRADGGWGQTPDLPADAYATGMALYTLHELGVPAEDPAYRRGVQYLLAGQAADGSWRVKSRTPKFQPYFDTVFPYGHDQWISAAATAWAATALSYAGGVEQVARR
ncbi:MAG: ankyrin repeat domain-containing protein [Acidobacteria bacterium]|nr:ankyrin repeat domain-containing protein [Acidobacteriota bacterium]